MDEVIHDQTFYLMHAAFARDYVKKKLDIGSSDQLPNSYYGWPARMACVSQLRDEITKDLASQKKDVRASGGNPNRAILDTWADWAKTLGCGNCGPQSALAFTYLRDTYHVFPLDWMVIEADDHGFVVLGRIGVTDPSNMGSWNSEAVVCDPWKGRVLRAADAGYLSRYSPKLLYRMVDARAA